MKKILIFLLAAFALAACSPAGTSEVKFENNDYKIERISLGGGTWIYVATEKNKSGIVSTRTEEKHPVTTITINEMGDTLSIVHE